MEHTKGPWHIGVRTVHHGRDIYGPLGESVAITDDVCTAQDEALANARLIAAAPEMLEALKFVVNNPDDPVRIDEDGWVTITHEQYSTLKDAIAKAEGK